MQDYTATVICPCRNEIHHIDVFIESLTKQQNFNKTEFIIADGMSDDGTKESLLKYSKIFTNILIIDNPLRIVSSGLNIAANQASNKIIIRMDIHSEYDEYYINNCINCLISNDAQCVGGPWVANSSNLKQNAIAASFQSKWVVGGARSRDINFTGEVDTVYLGCWWKDYLLKIGGFDENLVRNQDDELCMRIRQNGDKIFQDSSIKSFYFPRSKFKDLFKQYMQYGFWKVKVIKKYGKTASLRHFALILFFGIQLLSLIFSIFYSPLFYLSLAFATSYFIAISLIATTISYGILNIKFSHVVISIFFMHFSYSLGMLYSFLLSLRPGKKNTDTMNDLSR